MKLRSLISNARRNAAEAFYAKRFSKEGDLSPKFLRRIRKEERLASLPKKLRVNSKEYEDLIIEAIFGMLNYLTYVPSSSILANLRQQFTISDARFYRIMNVLTKQGRLDRRWQFAGECLWRKENASSSS